MYRAHLLAEHVPEPIAEGDPTTFSDDRPVTMDELIAAQHP